MRMNHLFLMILILLISLIYIAFYKARFGERMNRFLLNLYFRELLLILIILMGTFLEVSKVFALESDYGELISKRELERQGWIIDTHPEGKMIGEIQVISLPVFLTDERLGSLTTPLNYLHVTTKTSLILKESRLKSQTLWSPQNALETERNLRGLNVFTSARVYPVKPRHLKDSEVKTNLVDVVIITRDLWSLRLESNFNYNGGVLNQLNLGLTERNFLGRRILLSGFASMNPFAMTYGATTSHRRFGPDLYASAGGSGTWNRASGEREGEHLEAKLAHPLYNLDQHWSFGAAGAISRVRARITQGDQIVTDDDPSTENIEEIPIEWELRSWGVEFSATRQWRGQTQKALSLGLSASETARSIDSHISDSLARKWRDQYLPPDRLQIGPSLSFSWYHRDYITFTDISTYGTREDLRLGPILNTSHQFVLIGDRAYIPSLTVGYVTTLFKGGFISLSASASARIESQDHIVNRTFGVGARWAIPLRTQQTRLGLLVGRGLFSDRWQDVSNVMVSLGGDTGLRGYPSGAFTATGGGFTSSNLEYRSPPFKWSFLHLGTVLFYDGGSVHNNSAEFLWRQSLGGGLRFLFPQLNRSVFRIDLATPLSEYPTGLVRPTVVLSFGSAQAFAVMPWEG